MSDAVPRKRFDVAVVDEFRDMAEQLLKSVPEVEVLTLVMSWGVPQTELPPAVFFARGGRQTPQQIVLTIEQLLRGLSYELQQLGQYVDGVKDFSVNLGKEVNDKKTELESLEKAIAAKTAELEAFTRTDPACDQ